MSGVVEVLPADVAGRLRAAELTYREVGATAGVLPSGYRHLRTTVRLGTGAGVFDSASAAVLGWRMHLRAGLRVAASSLRAEPGAVVVLGFGAGPIRLHAPCRVVYTVDEPDRRGFAYGTLPGHPERGEESFVVERHADDVVTFTVTTFTAAAGPAMKLAGPLGEVIRRWITRRYIKALTPAR